MGNWTIEANRWVLRPDRPLIGLLDGGFAGQILGEPDHGAPWDHRRAAVPRQVHGAETLSVTAPGDAGACDALITESTDLVLTVRTADCVPLLMSTPHRIAVVHAGWRGLAQGVIEEALGALGSLETVRVVVGPGIGVCCFEVGPSVAQEFPQSVRWFPARPRPHVDLAHAATTRLSAAGLGREAIETLAVCTRCHQHLLYSHRGSGGGAGRIIAFARRSA